MENFWRCLKKFESIAENFKKMLNISEQILKDFDWSFWKNF